MAHDEIMQPEERAAEVARQVKRQSERLRDAESKIAGLLEERRESRKELAVEKAAHATTRETGEIEISRRQDGLVQLREQLADANVALADAKTDNDRVRSKVGELTSQIRDVHERRRKADGKVVELRETVEQRQRQVAAATETAARDRGEFDKKLAQVNAERDELVRRADGLVADVDTKRAEIAVVEERVRRSRAEAVEAEKKTVAISAKVEEARKAAATTAVELRSAQAEIRAAETRAVELHDVRAADAERIRELEQDGVNLRRGLAAAQARSSKWESDLGAAASALEHAKIDAYQREVKANETAGLHQQALKERDDVLAEVRNELAAAEARTTDVLTSNEALKKETAAVSSELQVVKKERDKACADHYRATSALQDKDTQQMRQVDTLQRELQARSEEAAQAAAAATAATSTARTALKRVEEFETSLAAARRARERAEQAEAKTSMLQRLLDEQRSKTDAAQVASETAVASRNGAITAADSMRQELTEYRTALETADQRLVDLNSRLAERDKSAKEIRAAAEVRLAESQVKQATVQDEADALRRRLAELDGADVVFAASNVTLKRQAEEARIAAAQADTERAAALRDLDANREAFEDSLQQLAAERDARVAAEERVRDEQRAKASVEKKLAHARTTREAAEVALSDEREAHIRTQRLAGVINADDVR